MYLSRIELQPAAAQSPRFWRMFRDGYRLHQAVWDLFSDGRERRRDFLYRLDLERGRPRLLTLSARKPEPSELWKVEPKEFEPSLRAGDRLRFLVRVNPVVTRDGKRHDVVMDAKTALTARGVVQAERPREAELVQAAGTKWLLPRAEKLGVELDEVTLRADGYEVHRFPRGSANVSLATLDLTGVLVVREPDTLLGQVWAGIGPAKGFGCGLLLLARAG